MSKPKNDELITLVYYGDWTAIFKGDERIHWHDHLDEDSLLDKLKLLDGDA